MRLLHDALAIFDVVGGYLVVVLRFQILYVAAFRALHGAADARDVRPRGAPRPAPPSQPWGMRPG
ncbi:MAG TPA: hypothetical protein VME40_16680 [Caulobacteraceae bacterium]|nr:hypothetical protein [Caulobacteraceae bacterium]